MARRTRRQRVVWLPAWGSAAGQGNPRCAAAHGTFGVIAGVGTDIAGVQIPLTFDAPTQSEITAGTAPSLADFTQNGYKLKRFVGKIHLLCSRGERTIGQGDFSTINVLVVASLMVRRVDSAGVALASNPDDLDNTNVNNIMDPYVWRRSWMLGGHQKGETQTTAVPGLINTFEYYARHPGSNSEYGSVMDGPHIDTKVQRIVGPEERLFFEIWGRPYDWADEDNNNSYFWDIQYVLDSRIVAVPMRATNRRNASR